jgi:TolB-like protein
MAKHILCCVCLFVWVSLVGAQTPSGTSGSDSAVTMSSKLNVAVLDITGSGSDFSKEDLLAITSRFETELMRTGAVQVLERRNMDMILQEQGFQQSGACNTSECQIEVGQLLGVDRIITGSINKVDRLYTINLRMVHVGTGQNELSHALDIRGTMEDVLRGGCYEMAQIFAGLKEPTESHTVLTAEKSSIWPWVLGGVGVATAVITTVIITSQEDAPEPKQAIIE